MIRPEACVIMAGYNRWMNEKLYDLCGQLSDEERKRDRGAPFRSIHGTLNHLMVADRIWMGRFVGVPFSVPSLDHELYADFTVLREARRQLDEEIEAWAKSLEEARLSANITFTTLAHSATRTMPLWFAVQHFYNHQTHHRGQITTLIEQAGLDCGVTDLLVVPGGPVHVH